jgi:hypothetical protein
MGEGTEHKQEHKLRTNDRDSRGGAVHLDGLDSGRADPLRSDQLSELFAEEGGFSKGWSDKGWAGGGSSPMKFTDSPTTHSDSVKRMPPPEQIALLVRIKAASGNGEAAQSVALAGKEASGSRDGSGMALKAWEIPGELTKLFSKIRTNGDGKIDLDELGRAVQDNTHTGKAAQALAAVYALRGALAGSDRAISRENLSKLSDLQEVSKLLPTFDMVGKIGQLLLSSENFPADSNGVSKDLLLQRSQSKDLTAEERTLLGVAVGSFEDLRRLAGTQGDGLTRDAMRKLRDLGSEYAGVALTRKLEAVTRSVSEVQKLDTSLLFSDSGWLSWFQTKAVVPEAIQQGIVEDCNLLAPMASLARVNSAALRQMITPGGNGEFTVTFPGVPHEPITVKSPSQAELGLYSQSTKHGIWPAVIEKAFGEYVRRHPDTVGLAVPPCTAGAPPAECLSKGGLWEGINVLTGRQAQVVDLRRQHDSDFAVNLKSALDRGAVVTIASRQSFFRRPGDVIQNSHNYSVFGFDPHGPGDGTLILRDPYGKRSPVGEHTIEVRVDRLHHDFQWLAMEEKE